MHNFSTSHNCPTIKLLLFAVAATKQKSGVPIPFLAGKNRKTSQSKQKGVENRNLGMRNSIRLSCDGTKGALGKTIGPFAKSLFLS